MAKNKRALIEYHGHLSDASETQDVEFWNACTTEEKFSAAWELIQYYYESKGLEHELRFSRSTETVGEVES